MKEQTTKHFKTQRLRESGNPADRQSDNLANGQSGNPAVRQSGNLANGQSGNPAVRQSDNLANGQSGNPAVRQSGSPANKLSNKQADKIDSLNMVSRNEDILSPKNEKIFEAVSSLPKAKAFGLTDQKQPEADSFLGKQTYWENLETLHSSNLPDKTDNEFYSNPFSIREDSIERRDFLKLMGASLALTSMSCIRRPVEKIVPYANRPEEIEPGIANYYSSTFTSGGQGQSIVVKTREGRPIYLKGNSHFPGQYTGTSLQAQAHILNLYDPDRLQSLHQGKRQQASKVMTWEDLDEAVITSLKAGSVGLLTGSISSPSTNRLLKSFTNHFSIKHYLCDVIGADDVIEGQNLSFGESLLPSFHFDKAKIIVSVGADFLGTWLAPEKFNHQFAKGRKASADMNKLIVFEALHSLTGANADLRIRTPSSQFLNVIMALIYEIVVKNKNSSFAENQEVLSVLNKFSNASSKTGVDPAIISQLALDLWQKRGETLIVTGGLTSRTDHSKALQVATNFLNSILENDGKTIDARFSMTSYNGSYKNLNSLEEDLNNNRIKTLIVSGINPIYTFPHLRQSLLKANTIVHLTHHLDETSLISDWVAPLSHQMEAWGDAQLVKGVYSIQQPTIRPLYPTRTFEENLLAWLKSNPPTELSSYFPKPLGEEKSKAPEISPHSIWYKYLQNQWKSYHKEMIENGHLSRISQFEDFWVKTLHDGFTVYQPFKSGDHPSRPFRRQSLSYIAQAKIKTISKDKLELSIYAKSTLGDGQMANNGWLQELPDPVTKVVWDNYLLISPTKAKKLGFTKDGQHARLKSSNTEIIVPILISPGTHDQVVGLALGYGRTQVGDIGKKVGVNAYPFVNKDIFAGLEVSVEKVEGRTALAGVQGHHRMLGRQLVVEATLKDYLKSPSVNIHRHKLFSLYPKHEYKGHRWAMAIDLNACTGCSACMIACQSENNVPTVGKKYILQGREMHWIRIDRYYTGDENDPDVVFQPMLCQHCENASCEAVCPVAATSHGEEGLNQMTYNRCVGTRYCSNNCPYKVRRFNWFNYTKVADSLKNAYNPDVTVRSRGVMEKCTFCVQRIKEAKISAKRKDRIFKGEDVVTACQEACPAQAIVFGDINDPGSQVSEAFADERSFSVLEEYNNIPMVRYKTKIRNTEKLKSNR